MQPHPFELGRGERPALVPDRVGDAQAAEIVNAAPPGARAWRRRLTARRASRPRAARSATPREWPIVYGDFRSVKSAIASSADSSSLVGEHDLERRLAPSITASQVVAASRSANSVRRLGAEQVHQRRVELGAAALPGDRDRRVDPRAAVEDLDHVGEVHQARGHQDLARP